MTEHSMCQPGRPGPHGLGHAGSPVLTDLGRLAKYVVVDVGDVLHVTYRDAPALEMPHEHVSDGVGKGVAQMRGVVGSDPTDVEARRAARSLERLEDGGLRVVELHADAGPIDGWDFTAPSRSASNTPGCIPGGARATAISPLPG